MKVRHLDFFLSFSLIFYFFFNFFISNMPSFLTFFLLIIASFSLSVYVLVFYSSTAQNPLTIQYMAYEIGYEMTS